MEGKRSGEKNGEMTENREQKKTMKKKDLKKKGKGSSAIERRRGKGVTYSGGEFDRPQK